MTNWLKRPRWWQILVMSIVINLATNMTIYLIEGSPITCDRITPTLALSIVYGLLVVGLVEFCQRDKTKWEQQQAEQQQDNNNN